MMTFIARRSLNTGILLVLTIVAMIVYVGYWTVLRDGSFLSGWTLLGAMLFLTAYNARKKLPFLPLVNSNIWLQMHIYVGLGSFILFLMHIDFRLPNGFFEGLLANARPDTVIATASSAITISDIVETPAQRARSYQIR